MVAQEGSLRWKINPISQQIRILIHKICISKQLPKYIYKYKTLFFMETYFH